MFGILYFTLALKIDQMVLTASIKFELLVAQNMEMWKSY